MNLTDMLAAERRARLAAERKLELKCRELFEANRKLSQHALSLSGQVIEKRDEAEKLKEQSEQVRADLQRAEQHVETVERRLWDSVETITDGFAVFDAEDRLIAANTAWLSIFRFSQRIGPGSLYLEVLRCAVEEGHVVLDDADRGDWIARMLERWDAPPPLEPVTIRTVSGAWYRLVDRRSRDGDMVCLAQDVTALKQREGELDEARHRAEAANRAKSAFLANMSHELRTPMNGVVGMADMLLESDLDEEATMYVSTIKSSGEALLEIINHVLDFSKMEAERLVLRPEPFDLERLLHEVVTLLTPSTRDRSLGLHVDYDVFLPTSLTGDAMRIRQILINLVGNAVKFTSEGHVLIRVVGFEADADGGEGDGDEGEADGPRLWRLHLTVEDTGIGIPADMQEHIFGSFAQVESEKNRSFEGTGLGLSISRQLVELMGGEIWVESEEGSGACFGFSLTLPAAEPSRRPMPRVEPHLGRALLVAPPSLDADIMTRQFAQLGLDVTRATTGSEALEIALAVPRPQIVVLDETLPDTTGQALAEVLAESGAAAARLLVCASLHDAQRAEADLALMDAAARPIHGVLTRPVLRGQLFEALAHLPDASVFAPDPPPQPGAPALPVPEEAGAPVAGPLDAGAPPPARDTAWATPTAGEPGAETLPAATWAGDGRDTAAAVQRDVGVGDPGPQASSGAAPHLDEAGRPKTDDPDPETPEAHGPEAHGPEAHGPEVHGTEVHAPEVHGPEAQRPEAHGPEVHGPDVNGQRVNGPGAGKQESGVHRTDAPAATECEPTETGLPAQEPGLAASGEVEADPAAPIPFPAAASAPARPMRVLAAEDNKTNRFVLAKMLRDLEIELDFAEDGRRAVEKVAERAPDLVLMDISMPRMDGKEAARAIRAAEAEAGAPRVPIVAMTAHALAGDREEILASGIDRYMTKPLKRALIVAEVLDHCPAGCLPPAGDAKAVAG
ncbi:response regulator [Rhodovulum sp. 12E13]|uniref:response regulator n=1 Tax=Rhodovulum sp. 12E13 TaxID=2203891 RepID=UPI0013143059|nr:response regulator [Rhodovulum sp. 12E13]